MTDTSLIEFLHRALASPLGICLSVSDVKRAQQRLYAARGEAKHPPFANLAITPSRSNPTTQLWIVRTRGKDAQQV